MIECLYITPPYFNSLFIFSQKNFLTFSAIWVSTLKKSATKVGYFLADFGP